MILEKHGTLRIPSCMSHQCNMRLLSLHSKRCSVLCVQMKWGIGKIPCMEQMSFRWVSFMITFNSFATLRATMKTSVSHAAHMIFLMWIVSALSVLSSVVNFVETLAWCCVLGYSKALIDQKMNLRSNRWRLECSSKLLGKPSYSGWKTTSSRISLTISEASPNKYIN